MALPEILVAGDLNEDGKVDLAVNVTGFDNIAILTGDGLGGFTLKGHVATDTLPKGLAAGGHQPGSPYRFGGMYQLGL